MVLGALEFPVSEHNAFFFWCSGTSARAPNANIALDKSRCSHSTYLSIAENFGNFKLFIYFFITTDTTLRRGVIMLDTNWLQKSKELVNLSQAKKPLCVCTILSF